MTLAHMPTRLVPWIKQQLSAEREYLTSLSSNREVETTDQNSHFLPKALFSQISHPRLSEGTMPQPNLGWTGLNLSLLRSAYPQQTISAFSHSSLVLITNLLPLMDSVLEPSDQNWSYHEMGGAHTAERSSLLRQ